MKSMGFFQEPPHADRRGESLRECVWLGDESMKERIAHYLDRGSVVVAATRILHDILDEGRSPICSLHILTDGVWLWPSGLPFYVRRYNVRVPHDFISHAESSGWDPKVLAEEELDEIDREMMSGM
ncbi:hypothetical protein [Nocardiopsis sp. CNT312]|uniref:hypothetical protein n=1 Tax=Nocardiopsis sp. CNT312 TaxID=1137268 RepID=UPI001E53678A|nr:hypothetical protein [Nocardiopsis sp. CNT312]